MMACLMVRDGIHGAMDHTMMAAGRQAINMWHPVAVVDCMNVLWQP